MAIMHKKENKLQGRKEKHYLLFKPKLLIHRLQQLATAFWEVENKSQKEKAGKVDEKTYRQRRNHRRREPELGKAGLHTHNGKEGNGTMKGQNKSPHTFT